MVRKQINESEMQGDTDDDKKFGNKFLYQNKKQKACPWSNFENANDNKYTTKSFNSPTSSQFIPLPNTSKFDLDSVWSVRKNVPLSNNKQATQSNLQTGNSFYSRHAGGIVGSHQGKTDQKANSSVDQGNASWHLKKPGYSYSNQSSLKRQAAADNDDDDEFDFSETKKRSFQRGQSPSQSFDHPVRQNNSIVGKGGLANLINPIRKGSARTQRAQKMNEAYMRSAGLGFYAPNRSFRGKDEDDVD